MRPCIFPRESHPVKRSPARSAPSPGSPAPARSGKSLAALGRSHRFQGRVGPEPYFSLDTLGSEQDTEYHIRNVIYHSAVRGASSTISNASRSHGKP
jgi:predicted transcriptional regulator